MALSAEPALNHLIWLSLKVWFTGNSYVEPSGFLPTTVRALPGWEVCQALDADLVKGSDLQQEPLLSSLCCPRSHKRS